MTRLGVGTKRNPDGTDSPYELNISYVDALGPIDDELSTDQHAQRFLASQAIMMSLQGMPAVYFHSLVGTQNDQEAVETSGIPRRINRRKFDFNELQERLLGETLQAKIFQGMQRLLEIRTNQPAFHPDAKQVYVESGSDHVVCFERLSSQDSLPQQLLIAANFHDQPQFVTLPDRFHNASDLLSSSISDSTILLEPSQVVWLEAAKV